MTEVVEKTKTTSNSSTGLITDFKYLNLGDYRKLINFDTKLIIDADQVAFMCASNMEEKTIEVTNKLTGEKLEFKNKTEFWGTTKKVISGWLGDHNIMRELNGEEPYKKEDFEIVEKQTLVKNEKNLISHIDWKINQLAKHLSIPIERVVVVIGDGDCFRHEFDLPERYKANRKGYLKPLMLDTAKLYLKSKYQSEVVKGIEADDRITQYGYKGYLDYKETGFFSYVVATMDKDQKSTPSLVFDLHITGNAFTRPLPLIVEDDIGAVWLDGKKGLKGYGLLWLATQMLIGDDSDHVRPYQPFGIKFGATTCYKYLMQAQNKADVMLLVLKKYKEWFPDGVKFNSWIDDREINLTYAQWAGIIFKLVYMQRWENDDTNLKTFMQAVGSIK